MAFQFDIDGNLECLSMDDFSSLQSSESKEYKKNGGWEGGGEIKAKRIATVTIVKKIDSRRRRKIRQIAFLTIMQLFSKLTFLSTYRTIFTSNPFFTIAYLRDSSRIRLIFNPITSRSPMERPLK